jgi:hypothetical protein
MGSGIFGISFERYGICRWICGISRGGAVSPLGYAYADIC